VLQVVELEVTGEDLSRYLNKIELMGLRKAYCQRHLGDLTV